MLYLVHHCHAVGLGGVRGAVSVPAACQRHPWNIQPIAVLWLRRGSGSRGLRAECALVRCLHPEVPVAEVGSRCGVTHQQLRFLRWERSGPLALACMCREDLWAGWGGAGRAHSAQCW